MANCTNNTYTIFYTDRCKGAEVCQPSDIGEAIQIPKSALITDAVDISLVGKTRFNYGEIFNENILHLLENFAAPSDSVIDGIPDLSSTVSTILEYPTRGQIWYNSSNLHPYVRSMQLTEEPAELEYWQKLQTGDDVAGNHGIISDGEQLPLPVPIRNRINSPTIVTENFTYADCSWSISPVMWDKPIKGFICETDANANVTVKYILENDTVISGLATYCIIAIRGDSESTFPPL